MKRAWDSWFSHGKQLFTWRAVLHWDERKGVVLQKFQPRFAKLALFATYDFPIKAVDIST